MARGAKATEPAGSAAVGPPPAWVALTYEPVTAFSLRTSLSTSAGEKALLVPTPYAVKLALVNAEIGRAGVEAGERMFDALKRAPVALLPSRRACVTNTFVRVLKLYQSKGKKDEDEDEDAGAGEQGRPFDHTIRYRELCFLSGPMVVAVGLRSAALGDAIEVTARHVNYFGKRGGFFQLTQAAVITTLDERAAVVDPEGWSPPSVPAGDVVCVLDDLGPQATLSRVSPFSDESASWGRDRVPNVRLLPMRRVASGSHFTLYERIGG